MDDVRDLAMCEICKMRHAILKSPMRKLLISDINLTLTLTLTLTLSSEPNPNPHSQPYPKARLRSAVCKLRVGLMTNCAQHGHDETL